MDITIYTKDKVIKNITLNTVSNDDIIREIKKVIDINNIKRIDLDITFMHISSECMNALICEIEEFTECSTTKIKVHTITNLFFSVTISGHLGNVMGACKYLRLTNRFITHTNSINEDIRVINSILGRNSNMNDFNKSSILVFLSKCNGNISYSRVFDVINKSIKIEYKRKLLSTTFKYIYNLSIDDAKHKMNNDKLNLNSIDNKMISDIGKELNRRLFDEGR